MVDPISDNPFGDGSIREADIPFLGRHGTVLSPKERAAIAHKKGLCEICGIPTHQIKALGRRHGLSNDDVYSGICIRCNKDRVPIHVFAEWKNRNPLLAMRSAGSRGSGARSQGPAPAAQIQTQSIPSLVEMDPSHRKVDSSAPDSRTPLQVKYDENIPTSSSVRTRMKEAEKMDVCITVFQACPLAYEDYMGQENAISYIDLDLETEILKEAVEGTDIDIVFRTATADNLGTFLSHGNSLLHFSCHGHPKYLLIEDGYGGGQRLPVDDSLKGWIRAGGQKLSFVFVSACHSRSAGEAFVDAGVQHVVCCEQDGQALSDTAAMVFSREFYRAASHGRKVEEAFDLAVYAVIHSADLMRKKGSKAKDEAQKFALLPDKTDHNVLLSSFSQQQSSSWRKSEFSQTTEKPAVIPIPPQVFLGRELDMYHILKALFVKKSRLVRIHGAEGIGKLSMAKALAQYMDKRKMWGNVFWLPPLRKGGGNTDITTYVSRLFDLIEQSNISPDLMASHDEYRSVSQHVLDYFCEQKAVFIFNVTRAPDETISKLCTFLDEFFNRTRLAKVIVVHQTTSAPIESSNASSFPCLETEFSLSPLCFASTVALFTSVCPHSSSKDMDALLQKRSGDTFKVLGNGVPAKTLLIAREITAKDYNKLIMENDSIHENDFNESLTKIEEKLHQRIHSSLRGEEVLELEHEEDESENLPESAPPPLRTQAEVFGRFAPLLRKEGKICRKNVTSFIRRAVKGERVVTTIDGKQETQYKVEDNSSWVVCGKAAGEHYVLSEKQFLENYDTENVKDILTDSPQSKRLRQQGFREYRSRRQVWARKVDEHDMIFFRHGKQTTPDSNEAYFIAPWGESMLVEQGDFLVMQYPGDNNEIYRIECSVFGCSYTDESELQLKEDSQGKGDGSLSPSWALILPVLAVVVGILAGLLVNLSLQATTNSRRKEKCEAEHSWTADGGATKFFRKS
jgi:hypothetical protein